MAKPAERKPNKALEEAKASLAEVIDRSPHPHPHTKDARIDIFIEWLNQSCPGRHNLPIDQLRFVVAMARYWFDRAYADIVKRRRKST